MVKSDSGSPPDQPAGRVKAVAVKQQNEDALPRITATGRGKLAEQILDIAFASDVKVRQDEALVDILDTYELDSPVPLEALGAVSEILRYVYAANQKLTPASELTEEGSEEADKETNQPDSSVSGQNEQTEGD